MKIRSLLTATALVAASLAIVAPAPAGASECNAADPCGVWSMLDSNGTITNNIVCQASVCGGGVWDGQRVVPQAAPNPETHDTTGRGGHWGTYDEATKTFTVDRSGPNETPNRVVTQTEIIDGVTVEVSRPSNAHTFTYEDTVQTGQEYNPNFLKEIDLPFNSAASITAQSDSIDESIYFANRKTAMEVEGAISEANLSFLRDNIRIVLAKLQNWLMPE
jgi:hypothetical protein